MPICASLLAVMLHEFVDSYCKTGDSIYRPQVGQDGA